MMVDEVDDFLAHFGVKGMKWGVRKDRSVDQRIAKLDKTIKKNGREGNLLRRVLPAPLHNAGAGARAKAAERILKLDRVPNADGSGERLERSSRTPEITDSNRSKYDRKITTAATAKYVSSGAAFATGILLAGKVASTVVSASNPRMASLISDGSKLLAGLQVAHSTMTVAGIASAHNDAIRDQRVSIAKAERRKLLKQPS